MLPLFAFSFASNTQSAKQHNSLLLPLCRALRRYIYMYSKLNVAVYYNAHFYSCIRVASYALLMFSNQET